jgi:hypothetical protein
LYSGDLWGEREPLCRRFAGDFDWVWPALPPSTTHRKASSIDALTFLASPFMSSLLAAQKTCFQGRNWYSVTPQR